VILLKSLNVLPAPVCRYASSLDRLQSSFRLRGEGCKIQIPLTDTPSFQFFYVSNSSFHYSLCNQSSSIYLSSPFSLDHLPSSHNPVTRFPGPSQTYRRARSVLIPHVIATHRYSHTASVSVLVLTVLQVISRESGRNELPPCWGSRSGAVKLDTQNFLIF
jgi:hypothetical protein